VAQGGRAVLFVSHNAAAIESLCTRGAVLNCGQLVFSGTQSQALQHYSEITAAKTICLRDRTDRLGLGEIRIVAMELRDPSSGRLRAVVNSGDDVDVWLHFENRSNRHFPRLNALRGESFSALPASWRVEPAPVLLAAEVPLCS
jgi:lipopolysaccharide transport system ATP-binding protein